MELQRTSTLRLRCLSGGEPGDIRVTDLVAVGAQLGGRGWVLRYPYIRSSRPAWSPARTAGQCVHAPGRWCRRRPGEQDGDLNGPGGRAGSTGRSDATLPAAYFGCRRLLIWPGAAPTIVGCAGTTGLLTLSAVCILEWACLTPRPVIGSRTDGGAQSRSSCRPEPCGMAPEGQVPRPTGSAGRHPATA